MKIEKLSFGKIIIDGKEYKKDIIVEKGKIKPRDKAISRKYKQKFGHTPLTTEENIPWDCNTLVIATGFYGSLPVTEQVFQQSEKNGVEIKTVKTSELPRIFNSCDLSETNFIIHLTC